MNNRLWISLVLVAITGAVFWPVVTHDFVALDDDAYVTQNPPVASGLSAGNIQWAFTKFWSGNWHPLTWISHMVDVQLFGTKQAGGHHLTGLLFHLANVVLLFLLLSRLTGSVWKSAFVAALFGVHPLHVESVAWVAERKDVLSTFFWLLATLAYARYVEQPGFKRYILMAVLFALGLLSKPMLVTLPVTLLLLDYWPLGRLSAEKLKAEGVVAAWWPLVREKIPLFALVFISSVITFFAQRSAGAVGTFASTPLPLRLENVVISYARYLVKMVWPDGLGVYYPYYSNLLSVGWMIAAAIALLAISALVVSCSRKHGYLAFGWLWYLITLVPVIGLIQVGGQSMADRYTYVPLIGIFVMVAWGIPDLLVRPQKQTRGRSRSARRPEESRSPAVGPAIAASILTIILIYGARVGAFGVFAKSAIVCVISALVQRSRQPRVVAAAIVVAIFMVCTWIQVGYWKDGITLFTRTIAVTGPNDIMQNNLGVEYFTRKKYDDAVPCFEEAIRINPDYREAQGNLGNTLKELGRDQESLSPYRAVVRLKPEDATAQNNLGMALVKTGSPKEAEKCFAEALKLSPRYAAAHSNLGLALSAEGRLDDALAEQKKAIKLDPKYAEAHGNLGLVYAQQGRIADAMKSWREAIRLNPDYAEGQFNLGLALSNTGKPDEAIEHLTKAVKVKPNYIKAHVTLASLFATKGDYAGAWKEVKALRENGAEPDPGFVALLTQKMPEPP